MSLELSEDPWHVSSPSPEVYAGGTSRMPLDPLLRPPTDALRQQTVAVKSFI